MQQQSTTRTVESRTGMIIPATIDQRTEMAFIPAALATYQRINGRRVAWDTLMLFGDAMRDSSAVVAMYTDAKGELAARCLWPNTISLTKDNAITCKAYCTLRREWRSFRLDRVLACHPLTTPDDVLTDDEMPEPHADFEDSIAGAAFR